MTGERRAVLDFIQNLAVELKKVSDKNRKRREDIRNNPDMPIREQISASGEWRGITDMNAAFMDYAESLGFTDKQIWAKINGEKSMKLKFEMTDYEVKVLKKALESYPKNKDITHCLLGIIEAQCESQKEKGNNND